MKKSVLSLPVLVLWAANKGLHQGFASIASLVKLPNNKPSWCLVIIAEKSSGKFCSCQIALKQGCKWCSFVLEDANKDWLERGIGDSYGRLSAYMAYMLQAQEMVRTLTVSVFKRSNYEFYLLF